MITRRQLLKTFGAVPFAGLVPLPVSASRNVNLTLGEQPVNLTGKAAMATTVNQSLPAPILKWREGETVTINVKNNLPVDSSLHWHGIILPSNMDGVPGLSFAGIKPGQTYQYKFTLNQSGTYWYHSHSGFQEQTGMFGAIVIEPKGGDPWGADRDYVIQLSDWSDESPQRILSNLRKNSHFYNRNRRTLQDTLRDIRTKGLGQTFNERQMWNDMRMADSDISDVTGFTYTYLMNGQTNTQGWHGQFNKGERVRLRFINAAAMTFFDIRIPGLSMKVIAADGQDVEPVTVNDFRLGVAETLDVLVEPESDIPYAIFAQAMDRSGFALGHLSPKPGLTAQVPMLDPVPILTHQDMGMDMDMSMDSAGDGGGHHHHHMHHHGHAKSTNKITHAATEFGPHVDMRAENPQYRLDDPGPGLREHHKQGRRVLTYADLARIEKPRVKKTPIKEPDQELELHLTGNMERYLWSINGIPYHDADPIYWKLGSRTRVTLVNDTMMSHPMHLHGMWSELETGNGYLPWKHTVVVLPGSKISYQVDADVPGKWAYHCHLMYHMMGMFREVHVS